MDIQISLSLHYCHFVTEMHLSTQGKKCHRKMLMPVKVQNQHRASAATEKKKEGGGGRETNIHLKPYISFYTFPFKLVVSLVITPI